MNVRLAVPKPGPAAALVTHSGHTLTQCAHTQHTHHVHSTQGTHTQYTQSTLRGHNTHTQHTHHVHSTQGTHTQYTQHKACVHTEHPAGTRHTHIAHTPCAQHTGHAYTVHTAHGLCIHRAPCRDTAHTQRTQTQHMHMAHVDTQRGRTAHVRNMPPSLVLTLTLG